MISTIRRVFDLINYGSAGVNAIKSTGIHKPLARGARHTALAASRVARTVNKISAHPASRASARFGFHIAKNTAVGIHCVATHPTTAKITHKAWLHGGKIAKHTSAFMVKAAIRGFKFLRS